MPKFELVANHWMSTEDEYLNEFIDESDDNQVISSTDEIGDSSYNG